MSNCQGVTKRVTRHIVTTLHRIDRSTDQRCNGSTWRSHSSFSCRAFTIIELVVVLGVILILTGLVLSTVGYARKKGARARAETEIAAMSAACENYKADNAIYPRTSVTDTFTAVTNRTPPDPQPTSYDASVSTYSSTSFYLYGQLSGNPSGDRTTYTQQRYFQFKPNMLAPAGGTGIVSAITDPFGNSYGYSTAKAANPSGTVGYNPTYDLWSTAGVTTGAPNQAQWIKNW